MCRCGVDGGPLQRGAGVLYPFRPVDPAVEPSAGPPRCALLLASPSSTCSAPSACDGVEPCRAALSPTPLFTGRQPPLLRGSLWRAPPPPRGPPKRRGRWRRGRGEMPNGVGGWSCREARCSPFSRPHRRASPPRAPCGAGVRVRRETTRPVKRHSALKVAPREDPRREMGALAPRPSRREWPRGARETDCRANGDDRRPLCLARGGAVTARGVAS